MSRLLLASVLAVACAPEGADRAEVLFVPAGHKVVLECGTEASVEVDPFTDDWTSGYDASVSAAMTAAVASSLARAALQQASCGVCEDGTECRASTIVTPDEMGGAYLADPQCLEGDIGWSCSGALGWKGEQPATVPVVCEACKEGVEDCGATKVDGVKEG